MSTTADTPFVPEDDTYHPASSEHPLWVATGWSAHMEVELVDLSGRTMEAEGTAESHMCEHAAGSNALMRWEYEGQVGWCEDQDGWKLEHFQRMRDALRDPAGR